MNIVIVDNKSPDRSGEVLFKEYKNSSNVTVLLNQKNEGFAAGNNLGYRYAKDKLRSDVIICLNNDIEIKDKLFVSKLEQSKYLCTHEIIAPDIINKLGFHQNPLLTYVPTRKQISKSLTLLRCLKIIYSIPFIYSLTHRKEKKKNRNEFIDPEKSIEGLVPHGAFVIYTKKWIDSEDFAFYPGTFMYGEEQILAKYCQNKDYKIVYEPILKVHHLEDVSTNTKYKKPQKKAIFQIKNMITSHGVMLNLYK